MWRFELSKMNYEKLKKLIRQREHERPEAERYKECIGEYPPTYGGQIHHVDWRSHGGPDREDNLVLLSIEMHDRIHAASRRERKELNGKFKEYLESEEVESWRERHGEELEALYETAEKLRMKKLREGCIPKKRPGLPF